MPAPEIVSDLTNQEFIERFALPGRVGLAGGASPLSRVIRRAQRHVAVDGRASRWSHAFLFQDLRRDRHRWVIESDLEIARKHIRLGVQENRVSKFCDPVEYPCLAVIDFGLDSATENAVISSALEMVAGHIGYSLRELIGTLVALRHGELRKRRNF